jgi:hypothetical protein
MRWPARLTILPRGTAPDNTPFFTGNFCSISPAAISKCQACQTGLPGSLQGAAFIFNAWLRLKRAVCEMESQLPLKGANPKWLPLCLPLLRSVSYTAAQVFPFKLTAAIEIDRSGID